MSPSRPLSAVERRLLLVLGLPTLALGFATTVVSTYLPVVASRVTSSTVVIGVIIVGDGLMAIMVAPVAGAWSDRFRNRGGSRLIFIVGGLPVVIASLVGLAVVRSLIAMGLLVATFFAGFLFAYEPYRALYPDLLTDAVAGRAQGTQAAWRGTGTMLALAAGGLLLTVWTGLPFIVAGALQTAGIGALVLLLPRVSTQPLGRNRMPAGKDLGAAIRDVVEAVALLLKHQAELRLFLIGNCLWELALGAVKTFVILYVTDGLGYSLASASLIVGAVALVILLGAFAGGELGDLFGNLRTMHVGLWLYGLALVVPVFTRSEGALLVAVPVIAFGGGLTMALPYAVLMPLMPEEHHGMMTGFYSLSRGLGAMLGPLLAGAAIELLRGPFASTHGYAAMWIVTSAAILLSIPVLSRLQSTVAAAGPQD